VTMRLGAAAGVGAGLGRRGWPQYFCTASQSAMLSDTAEELEILLDFGVDSPVDDRR
jgi:hypothetical protein